MGGFRPVSFGEISDMDRALGLNLEPWEMRELSDMSLGYVQGLILGEGTLVKAPTSESLDADPGIPLERKLLSEKLGAMLKAAVIAKTGA